MGVEVPSSYDVELDVPDLQNIVVSSVGPVGPVAVTGIPSAYSIAVTSLPQINIKAEPVEVVVRLTEIPSVRGHIPAHYRVGLSILGLELLAVSVCGETQVITEPYVPNPCERCGHPRSDRVVAGNAAAELRLAEP
jgi:hypothetical protein